MDSGSVRVLINRIVILLMLMCIALFFVAAAFKQATDRVPYSGGVVNDAVEKSKYGRVFEICGIAFVAVLVIAFTVELVSSMRGVSAHRRKEHATAKVYYDYRGNPAGIEVNNLDDMDVREMGMHVHWALMIKTNMGNGVWRYSVPDPYDIYPALQQVNVVLDGHINKMKDRIGKSDVELGKEPGDIKR